MLTCNLPLVLVFVSFLYLLCAFGPYSSTMPRKTRANRIPFIPSVSHSRVCIESDLGILFNWVKIDEIGLLS